MEMNIDGNYSALLLHREMMWAEVKEESCGEVISLRRSEDNSQLRSVCV